MVKTTYEQPKLWGAGGVAQAVECLPSKCWVQTPAVQKKIKIEMLCKCGHVNNMNCITTTVLQVNHWSSTREVTFNNSNLEI
jgi:hypothetical protein